MAMTFLIVLHLTDTRLLNRQPRRPAINDECYATLLSGYGNDNNNVEFRCHQWIALAESLAGVELFQNGPLLCVLIIVVLRPLSITVFFAGSFHSYPRPPHLPQTLPPLHSPIQPDRSSLLAVPYLSLVAGIVLLSPYASFANSRC